MMNRTGQGFLIFAVTAAFLLTGYDVLRAFIAGPIDLLSKVGQDEIMRLVSVREWLGGAGWFDTTIDRVAPPEGASLHWSRYVDVPIAALILALGSFMPIETAEGLAIVIWPTILLALYLWLSARQAGRIAGPVAAGFAILATLSWDILTHGRFGPLRIDHHGVQILLVLCMVLVLLKAQGRWQSGVLAGLAGAASLAVGLEMLPAIALAGIALALQAAGDPARKASQLLAFGPSLALGAGALFLGQTPPAEWALARCDELALPILQLCAVAAIATGILALSLRHIPGTGLRVISCLVAGVVAVAVAWPGLQPCFAGPYGNLSSEVQAAIVSMISEARPGWVHLVPDRDNGPAFRFLMPALSAAVIGSFMLLRGGVPPEQRRSFLILLAFVWLGVAGFMVQMRLLVLAEPATPLLIGLICARLVHNWRASRPATGPQAAVILGVAVMILPGQIYTAFETKIPARAHAAASPVQTANSVPFNHCRLQPDVVRSLNTLPPSNLMAMANLGISALLLTDHDIGLALYHRSSPAMEAMLLHLERDGDAFLEHLHDAGTDYLVLCRDMTYIGGPEAHASQLAHGMRPAGYREVHDTDPQLVVLEVLPR